MHIPMHQSNNVKVAEEGKIVKQIASFDVR